MKYFAILMLLVFAALSCSNSTGPSVSSKAVFAIHQIELKANVNPSEFEKFVLTEVAPVYNQIKGMQFSLVKGDRGSRVNKYAVMLSFDSIEDRNRIFPSKGESQEDWGDDEVWEKFGAMASGLGEESFFTDYVEI